MSANQQFKSYMAKLETAAKAKGPLGKHSRAKLADLREMDRTDRFKWFCANVLGEDVTAPVRDKREDAAVAIADADRDAKLQLIELLAADLGVTIFGGTVVEEKPKASKPKASTKNSRRVRRNKPAAKQDGVNRWRISTLEKLGYKHRDGQQFKHKGTRWIIVDTDAEFAYTVKA